MLFSTFPYDYYVLWASPPQNAPFTSILLQSTSNITQQPASDAAREPYLRILENHLRFLHTSPPLIGRMLQIIIGTGFTGLLMKLYKPNEANLLFDGASLVLYVLAIGIYVTNIVKGMRIVAEGLYGDTSTLTAEEVAEVAGEEIVGREDSLKVIAASNTILALVLMGVLVLQAGQWYAQQKEAQEIEKMDKVAAEKRERRAQGGSGNQVEGVKGAEGKKKR